MQRLGLVTGLSTPSALAMKTYEELDEAGPDDSNVEALEVLFHGVGNESRWKQQKRKLSS